MKTIFLGFLLVLGLGATAAEMSLSAWRALDKDAKINAIFNEDLPSERFESEDVNDEFIRLQLADMAADASDGIDKEEIEQNLGGMETIVAIGDPQLSYVTVYKVEGQVVAISVHLFQRGGATSNDEAPEQWYYETEEEAIAAGIDTGADVSWSGEAQYLWDGKTWQPLNYTDYEGRGFSWSGW